MSEIPDGQRRFWESTPDDARTEPTGLERAREVFEGAGLAMPPVPAALAPTFSERGNWLFATRDMKPGDMYFFGGHYAQEVVAEPLEDYVAVCHAGHGVNSYAITYQLVYRQLVLFAQTAWGGVYMDAERSSAEVREQFLQCALLIEALERAGDRLPAPPARLIVMESTMLEDSLCDWLDAPLKGDHERARAWLDKRRTREPGALTTALELIRAHI